MRAVEIGGQPVAGYAPFAGDPFLWTEGTFVVSLLDRRLGRWSSAEEILRRMQKLQDPVSGGLRYASARAVTRAPEDGTTFTDFPSTAAAAWLLQTALATATISASSTRSDSRPAQAG